MNTIREFTRLCRIAKRQGLNQQAIADRLGLSKSSVQKRLSGDAPVREGEIIALAAILEREGK
jgi:transcriptional regulator with XRE-family HTH domain